MAIPGLFRSCCKWLALPLLLWSELVLAWGPQGHRVAGSLAATYLSETSRAAVQSLIGNESLAEASTWADRMRGNSSTFWQNTAGPYHYVTVPSGKTYAEVGAPRKGDSVTALAEFRKILADPSAGRAHKQLALRFSLHIIQDLHQPMHVGNGRDRGGNDIKLRLRGKSTNLHRVWDSAILAVAGRSDGDWVARLSGITPQQAVDWAEPDPLVWIAESAALRDRVYPRRQSLGEDYLQQWLPTVQQRLQQSALRSAAWLNEMFEASSTLPNP